MTTSSSLSLFSCPLGLAVSDVLPGCSPGTGFTSGFGCSGFTSGFGCSGFTSGFGCSGFTSGFG